MLGLVWIVKFVPTVDNVDEKKLVFIFEKGNIIITGAKTQGHIISLITLIT